LSELYLDTSAAVKLMVEEAESDALARWLQAAVDDGAELVSSMLLETIDLAELPPSLFHQAGTLPGTGLRGLDALHLTSAVRFGVTGVVTYDDRRSRTAEALGIPVHRPVPAA